MSLQYRYDGPKSEAVLVRNRTQAQIRIGVPLRDVCGEKVPSPEGGHVQLDIILGSILDEGIDGSDVQPGVLVEKKEWERLAKRPVIQGLIRNGSIETFAAPLSV